MSNQMSRNYLPKREMTESEFMGTKNTGEDMSESEEEMIMVKGEGGCVHVNISGAAGVGKTTVALLVSKALQDFGFTVTSDEQEALDEAQTKMGDRKVSLPSSSNIFIWSAPPNKPRIEQLKISQGFKNLTVPVWIKLTKELSGDGITVAILGANVWNALISNNAFSSHFKPPTKELLNAGYFGAVGGVPVISTLNDAIPVNELIFLRTNSYPPFTLANHKELVENAEAVVSLTMYPT